MSNSYTDIFTGSPVQPSDISYESITLTSNITLNWPQTGLETTNVAARIINVSANAGPFSITMPDATQVSTGQDVLFRNTGANTFSVLKNDGVTPIASIASGQAYYIYLTNNTTAAGEWSIVQFGTGTSSADAATLAGAGLKAITTTLNVNMTANTLPSNNPNYSVTSSDRGTLLVWTAGSGTLSLPDINDVGDGFIFSLNNASAIGGEITVTPDNSSQKIDGFDNFAVSVTQSSSFIASIDGSDLQWYSLGFGKDLVFSASILNKDVSGNSNITLTNVEVQNNIIRFFGTLTGNITVFFPPLVNNYVIWNDVTTPTSFTLTIQTIAGSLPYLIPEGQKFIFFSNGTDLYSAPTSVAQGSLTLGDGTVLDPSFNFSSGPNTGPYLVNPGVDNFLGFSIEGVNAATLTNVGFQLPSTNNPLTPNYAFTGTVGAKSGMYLDTTNNNVTLTYDGSAVAQFDATGITTTSGNATAPSYSTIGDDDTGAYSPGANKYGITCGGAQKLQIDANGVATILGSAASPSYSILGDDDTGAYSPAANQYGITCGGAQIVHIDSTGISTLLGSDSDPSYSIIGDDDTGTYSPGPNQYGITCGGNTNATFSTTDLTLHNGYDLRLNNTGNTFYVGFKANAATAANTIWTLPLVDGSANQALITNGSASLSWKSFLPQVFQTSLPTAFNTGALAANTYADVIGLAQAITPNSNTNKVLVQVTLYVGANATVVNDIFMRVIRNGSPIGVGTPSASQIAVGASTGTINEDSMQPLVFTYLDSPASTLAQTYQVQIAGDQNATYYVNQAEGDDGTNSFQTPISTITLTEVIV